MYPGPQIIKLTQIKLLKLLFLLLLVVSIAPQMNLTSKPDVESIIHTIKSHYLDLMGKHSDWLKRILGVVKIELTYRQVVWKCTNDTCLYSIKLSQPTFKIRQKRSLKRRFNHEKPNKMMDNKDYFKTKNIDKEYAIDVDDGESFVPNFPNFSSKSNEIHMSECKEKYVYYCQNGAKCVYIDLLQDAVCICKKGFTGKRCVDFSLSDTVQSLRDFEMKTVNISMLEKKDYEAILSVMDATARFTYDANLKESEAVKNILDMPHMDN